MLRVAVEVVVVAAVRFVDHDDHVASVGEKRMLRPGLLLSLRQAELLQRGEVDAAGDPLRELVAQLRAVVHLGGALGEQKAAVEAAEQLAVELIAVGDDDDGRVLELRMPRHQVGVQLHLHRLARALRVPHDAGLAVGLDGLDGAADGLGDGEVLVRFRDALDEAVGAPVERGEVADELEEPLLVVETDESVVEGEHVGAVIDARLL